MSERADLQGGRSMLIPPTTNLEEKSTPQPEMKSVWLGVGVRVMYDLCMCVAVCVYVCVYERAEITQ